MAADVRPDEGKSHERKTCGEYFPGIALGAALTVFAPGSYAPALAAPIVDPSTLNPPPPAQFNPICKGVGDRTICDVTFTDPPAGEPEPTDIQCGSGHESFEILVSAMRSVDGKRDHDQDGNLTRRHFHDLIVGTYTNPLTGATASFRQHDTIMHDLAVAGDITSGTEAFTIEVRVTTADGGTVLIDALQNGDCRVGWRGLLKAGHHPFDAYFVFGQTSALQPLAGRRTGMRRGTPSLALVLFGCASVTFRTGRPAHLSVRGRVSGLRQRYHWRRPLA